MTDITIAQPEDVILDDKMTERDLFSQTGCDGYMDDNIKDIWRDVLGSAAEILPQGTPEIWLSSCRPERIEDEALIISVSNDIEKENIEKRIADPLAGYLERMGHAKRVIVRLDESYRPESIEPQPRPKIIRSENDLDPNNVFDTFVVGRSNNFAHAASLAVSRAPGQSHHNPLFIWGGVGLGKTHLMHAIAHSILSTVHGAKILYLSSEAFMNDFVSSILSNKGHDFRAKYRNLDVLLIDDIQFMGNKEGTQEEFFHTFNSLRSANKQIVISSDRPPKDIKAVEERLTSRFDQGLVTYIQQPDFETRVAILKKKSELKGIDIPEDVIMFIAKNITSNIRELEGALNRIAAHANLNGEQVSAENIGLWLKDIIRNRSDGMSINMIQQLTAEAFGITVDDLISAKRTSDISLARQVAMYLARETLNDSLSNIGAAFNKKDHTTVMHACKKIEAEIVSNIRVKMIVDSIKSKM